MTEKKLPDVDLLSLAKKVGTPFNIYDGKAIAANAKALYDAFSWVDGGFTDFFAVKALPNINVLRLLASLGFGADCSSLPELILAKQAGIAPEKIVFTSNDTPDEEFKAAYDMGVILNLDDISHIDAVIRSCGCLPKTLCFRYNPGPERTGNAIIGNPVEAKYGLTKVQLVEAYKRAKDLGVETFGLHTMVASNELDPIYIVETARMIFSLVDLLHEQAGVRISFVDLGGGVGIPYKKSDEAISFSYLGCEIRKLYESMIVEKGYGPIKVTFEMGRAITGPFGYLVSSVRHVCRKYKDYVGLDACMADLMRPALYGAYHHITVLGKENLPEDHVYDVTGSLCENNDKFAVDRSLPEIEEGDVLVIHDTGAHGHAMGFNYNAKLRHAEYLIGLDGKVSRIRRNETFDDYVRTMLYDPEEVM